MFEHITNEYKKDILCEMLFRLTFHRYTVKLEPIIYDKFGTCFCCKDPAEWIAGDNWRLCHDCLYEIKVELTSERLDGIDV